MTNKPMTNLPNLIRRGGRKIMNLQKMGLVIILVGMMSINVLAQKTNELNGSNASLPDLGQAGARLKTSFSLK